MAMLSDQLQLQWVSIVPPEKAAEQREVPVLPNVHLHPAQCSGHSKTVGYINHVQFRNIETTSQQCLHSPGG